MRCGVCVVNLGVLCATCVSPSVHREILGFSVSLSEAEVHWRAFLKSLKDRGLHGTLLITSDALEVLNGLAGARFLPELVRALGSEMQKAALLT